MNNFEAKQYSMRTRLPKGNSCILANIFRFLTNCATRIMR